MIAKEFEEQMELQKQFCEMNKKFNIENSKLCYFDILLCKDLLERLFKYAKANNIRVVLSPPSSVWEFKQEKFQVDWLEENGYINKSFIQASFDYNGYCVPHYEIGTLTIKGIEMLNDLKNLKSNEKYWVKYYNFKYFKFISVDRFALIVTAISTFIMCICTCCSFYKNGKS